MYIKNYEQNLTQPFVISIVILDDLTENRQEWEKYRVVSINQLIYIYIQTTVHQDDDLLNSEKNTAFNIHKTYFYNYTLFRRLWIYEYLVFISTKMHNIYIYLIFTLFVF
jgi:hypothetical protein